MSYLLILFLPNSLCAGGSDVDYDAITTSRIGFAVGDLAATHARLVEAHVEVVRAPEDRPWGRTAAYRDPDGNTVSLTEARR